MPEVLVVKSQEELDQAIQTSRADASIKQIEIRAKRTVAIMATSLPTDTGLHDVIVVLPALLVAGDSELELDDGVEARVYAMDQAFVGVQNLLPDASPLRGRPRLELRLAGGARAVTAARLRACHVAEQASIEATTSARGTIVLASGDAHISAYAGVVVNAEGRADVDAIGAQVECCDDVTVEASAGACVKAAGRSTVKAMSADVEARGHVRVVARGKTAVAAYDETRVVAYDDAQVKAFDQAAVAAPGPIREDGPHRVSITAVGQVQVDARGNAMVTLGDHAVATLRDVATAEARHLSRVDARDSSRVAASDEASVTVRDRGTVTACQKAHVRALDGAAVIAEGECRVVAADHATVRAQGRVEVTATGAASVLAGDHVQVVAADAVSVVATHYAVVTPRVTGDDERLLPVTPSAARERRPRVKVELHDFARVEGAPPSLEVTRKVGLAELDLAGLGMAQLVAGLGHEQSLER